MDGTWTRAALVALLTLIVATPAAAAKAVPDSWMQQARQIADAHWGMDPCHGDVTIAWGTLPVAENARSTWMNRFQDYGDPEHNTLCNVTFNVRQDWDWPKLCTIFMHEFGHLAGNDHSADPDDVMFAYYTGENAPECAKKVSPAGSRAPTAPRRDRQSPAAKRVFLSKAYRAGTTRHRARPGSRTRRR
jgi:hypothetical protein